MSIFDSSPLTWPYAEEEPPLEGPNAELAREAEADWQAFCEGDEEDSDWEFFAEDDAKAEAEAESFHYDPVPW